MRINEYNNLDEFIDEYATVLGAGENRQKVSSENRHF